MFQEKREKRVIEIEGNAKGRGFNKESIHRRAREKGGMTRDDKQRQRERSGEKIEKIFVKSQKCICQKQPAKAK